MPYPLVQLRRRRAFRRKLKAAAQQRRLTALAAVLVPDPDWNWPKRS